MSGYKRLPTELRGGALAGVLGMTLFLPPLAFFLGLSSSMALGTSLAAITATVVSLRTPAAISKGLAVGLVVATLILLHGVLALTVEPIDVQRAVLSLAPLLLVLVGGASLSQLIVSTRPSGIDTAVTACITFMAVAALAAVCGLMPVTSGVAAQYDKPVFPFTEPSHFALAFIPLLTYRCVRATGLGRLFTLMLGFAVALGLQNLTLLVGVLLVGGICLPARLLPWAIGVLMIAAFSADWTYYLDRLDFSGEGQNLSNLVYVQGWQLISESMDRSSGWGLGFQQLGVRGSETAASDLIFALLGDNANLLDGGFTLAKVVSEFGVLGVVIAALLLLYAWHSLRVLRAAASAAAKHPAALVWGHSMIAAYLIELLIRGAGYFTGTGLLLIAGVMLVARARSTATRSRRRPSRAAAGEHPAIT